MTAKFTAENAESAEERKVETAERLNALSEKVIGAGIAVHRGLGPGLLESAYQACLAHEMDRRGVPFEREKALPVRYRGVNLDCGYRLDFLVDGRLIVELKATERLEPIHEAQVLSYLRLADRRLALLMNFNVGRLKDGVRRLVNGFPDSQRPLRSPR